MIYNKKETRDKRWLSVPNYYHDNSLTGQRKTTKILSKDSRCPSQDLNQSSPEYESESLQLVLTSSVGQNGERQYESDKRG
jgi:hypothetical protein